jgi:ribonuclease HII
MNKFQVSALRIKEIKELLDSQTEISEELRAKLLLDERIGVQRLYEKYLKRLEQEKAEKVRVAKLYEIETSPAFRGQKVAGIDEAGRGPLAGPVYAAAVILPPGKHIPKLNDSKKISPKIRDKIAQEIKEWAISWAVGYATVEEIEELNILHASHLAMERALSALHIRPEHVLVDGNINPKLSLPTSPIIDGDSKCACIAAASILAKTERDKVMDYLAKQYPLYGFAKHKGYGTVEHFEAIRKYGISPVHRNSFLRNKHDLA